MYADGSRVEFRFIEEVPADDPDHPDPDSARTYARYGVFCLEPDGNVAVGGGAGVILPADEAVDIDALRNEARAKIVFPVPEAGTPSTHAYYQLPTWLWVENDPPVLTEVSASADDGPVSVSVTARLTGTTWTMGDGNTQTCDGLGTAWEAGLPETAATCSYTYTRFTEPVYEVSVAFEWELTFESQGRPLGDPETVTGVADTFSLPVGEIQTIITN